MLVSMKHTHEIMEAIRGKNINKALKYLELVKDKKTYVPFRKYPSKGHKQGVPRGYPVRATKMVNELVNELKQNAKAMGFDENKIVVSGYDLGRAAYSRFRSGSVYRHGKRTYLSVYSLVDQVRKETKKPVEKKETQQEPAIGDNKKEAVADSAADAARNIATPENEHVNKQENAADNGAKD